MYSEIEAAIIAKSYTVIRSSVNVACAFAENQLNKLLEKIWTNLSFVDNNTGGGFSHGRTTDTTLVKRAGQFKMINGVKTPVGWGSLIQGLVVDKPGKLRGDRTDILMFEEVGLWPNFLKTYTLADALVGQIGRLFGVRLLGGTGGESGPALEGLRKIYYNPVNFGVLPYKHSYTQTGDSTISAFFLPAFKTIKDTKLLDRRGWISDKDGKAYFDSIRRIKESDPQDYVIYCAEFCYNAEEAFSLEGDNKFNKVNIAELLTRIRALKLTPPIDTGYIEYVYRNSVHSPENITGFRWIPNENGKIRILEHPIWTLELLLDENGNRLPKYEKMSGLYVMGIDGIDIGKAQTSDTYKDPSDFCIVVKKRAFGLQLPQYVAIYKDRPQQITEAYKIAIKLALYYNAVINIEATRISLVTWARNNHFLSYFMKRPRATLTDVLRGTSKQYGTPATNSIIEHQTDLIAEYVEDYCHLIWFEDMLVELETYNQENKRKFDIMASLGMAELADEELSGVVPKGVEIEEEDEWLDIGYYIDENGIKRRGIIPTKKTPIYNISTDDDIGIRTSDPRKYHGYLS